METFICSDNAKSANPALKADASRRVFERDTAADQPVKGQGIVPSYCISSGSEAMSSMCREP
jgi:hypothetical protein